MITPAVRLGLRLLRGNDLVLRLRSILAALGAAICVLLLLGVLAAWQVGRVAEARNVAQAPHPDPVGTLAYYQVTDRWHGSELDRVYLAAIGPDAPVPPGLSRLPAAGEVALSPRLAAALAGGDPELTTRFGGLRVTRINRSGLTSQSQQLAYLGTSAALLQGSQTVSGFGDADQITRTTARLKLLSLLLFIVFVGVPYAGMCAVATRLGAAARRRRLTALWTIGISPRQLRLAAAVEAAVAVFAGALVGLASYQGLRPVLAGHLSINGIRPYAADLGLPLVSQLAVLIAVVLVAIVSGTLLSGSTGWRGSRPNRAPHRFSAVPLLVLGLGTLLALATAWVVSTAARSLLAVVLLDCTAAALVVGASLSLATLVQRAGGLIARSLPSGSALLAARRLESDPGAMARLGAVVLPAVFTIGFAATLASQFQLSDASAASQASFHGRQVGLVQAPPLPGAALDPAGITALAALPHTRTSTPLDVLVADCPQLRQLSGQPSLQCPAGRYLLELVNPFADAQPAAPTPVGGQPPASGPVIVTSVSGKSATLPVPATSLRLELATPLFGQSRAIVLPPDDPLLAELGKLPVWELTVAVPASDQHAVGALRASVAARNPLAELDLAGEDELTANAGYARYGSLVLMLALVASAVGLAGLTITALDAVLVRRRQLEPLLVLGISRSALRRATAAEITAPLVLAVLIGVGIATICGALFSHRNSSARLAVAVLSWSALAGVAVAVLVAAIATALVPSTPNRVSARPDG